MFKVKSLLQFLVVSAAFFGATSASAVETLDHHNTSSSYRALANLENVAYDFYNQANGDCSALGRKAYKLYTSVKSLRRSVEYYGAHSYEARMKMDMLERAFDALSSAMWSTSVSRATRACFDELRDAMYYVRRVL